MSPIETEYWDRIASGNFSIQSCRQCGARQAFPRAFCAHCGSTEVVWQRASGRGTVASLTTIHRAPTPEYRARGPYVIALVNLEEGVRVMAHGALDLSAGDPVLLSSHAVEERHLLWADSANRRPE